MDIRFYVDAETGHPHIHGHGVVEREVAEAFERLVEDGGGPCAVD